MRIIQPFVDMDGVVADFEAHAIKLIGMTGRQYEKKHGEEGFWEALWRADHEFYLNLPKMRMADQLVEGVWSITQVKPIFLTGCPREEDSKRQKLAWINNHFPGYEVICCKSREKCLHMTGEGDVLIDDYLKHAQKWVDHGGMFIHHLDVPLSLSALGWYVGQQRYVPPADAEAEQRIA